jgi:hypothetical protein
MPRGFYDRAAARARKQGKRSYKKRLTPEVASEIIAASKANINIRAISQLEPVVRDDRAITDAEFEATLNKVVKGVNLNQVAKVLKVPNKTFSDRFARYCERKLVELLRSK